MRQLIFFLVCIPFVAIGGQNTFNWEIDCEKMRCSDNFKEKLRLALNGDMNAQNEVGEMLHFGKGVKKNYASAKEWYLLASNQGHPKAPNHIGRLYLNGEGVQRNPLEACAWYKISGDRGHKWGKINFKKCHNRTRI